MKLHRDLGITQKTAWFVLGRLREAWDSPCAPFDGPVEVDETYVGGRSATSTRGSGSMQGAGRWARPP